MSLHQSFFGSVDLPDVDDSRPPRHRPDGVRVVRRPQPARPEAIGLTVFDTPGPVALRVILDGGEVGVETSTTPASTSS